MSPVPEMMATYHAILLTSILLASNGDQIRIEVIGKEKISNPYEKETRRLRAGKWGRRASPCPTHS